MNKNGISSVKIFVMIPVPVATVLRTFLKICYFSCVIFVNYTLFEPAIGSPMKR